jgi:hypothetical protein
MWASLGVWHLLEVSGSWYYSSSCVACAFRDSSNDSAEQLPSRTCEQQPHCSYASAGVLWVLPPCVQRAEAAAGFWLDSLAGLLSCGEVQQWEWLSIDVIWQCSCLLCTVDLVLVAREEQCTPYVRHYMMPRAAWCCQYAEPARVVVALGGR